MTTPQRAVRIRRIFSGEPKTEFGPLPVAPAKGAVRGAVAGFVSIVIGVATLASVVGYGLPQAALMGLFVGAWGGCGFGAMVGGTVAFLRTEDRARAEAAAARGQSARDSAAPQRDAGGVQ